MRMLFSLLALMCAMLPAAAAAQDGTHTLFVATDLHYISPSLTDHGEYFTRMVANGDGKVISYVDELTDAFIEQVIEKQPDCLILSGDITFNGARKSHEDLAAKLRRIDQSGVPVYVIPGNHDVYCYAAASFSGNSYKLVDSVSSEEFAEIYHDLGFDAAIARDKYSLSYIAEPVPGIRILMLDVNTLLMPGGVAQNTFTWLEEELARAQADGAKVIAVSHQNLYAHSSLLYDGYVIRNASMLKSKYERYGVAVNLSGHLHMQHTMTSESGLPEIATSSLSVSPCQYGVIETDGVKAQYHTEIVDVSAWAAENGKTDSNLLSFSQYAAGFFAITAINQAISQLTDDPDPSAMATWLANLNAAYFAGRMDTIDVNSELLERWKSSGAFFGEYIDSILSEELKDHTHFSFDL